MQLQAVLQVWLNGEVFDMTPQAAVEAPRFATHSFPDSFEPHASFPGRLSLENRFDADTADALTALGHDLQPWPSYAWRAGAVCYAHRHGSRALFDVAADPGDRRMPSAVDTAQIVDSLAPIRYAPSCSSTKVPMRSAGA